MLEKKTANECSGEYGGFYITGAISCIMVTPGRWIFFTSKGLETETGKRNRNKDFPQNSPKLAQTATLPVSVSLKCARNRNKKHAREYYFGFFRKICFLSLGHIIETEMETVFKEGGGSLRKFWDKSGFYLFLFPSLMGYSATFCFRLCKSNMF